MLHDHLFSLGLLLLVSKAQACQPPLGTPLAQGASSRPVGDQFNQQQPQIAFQESNSASEQLSQPLGIEPINAGFDPSNSIVELNQVDANQAFTPYPGYVPPPPPPPSDVFTVQGTETLVSPPGKGPVLSPLLDTGNSIVPTSNSDQVPSCPVELRFLSDFTACVESLPFVPSNEVSTTCDFEDTSYCRFQPTSSLFQRGKLPLPSHYATLAEVSGRTMASQPEGSFVYALILQPLSQDEELVMSTPVTCQHGNGVLKFDYWLVGDRSTTVKVCTQDSQSRSCTKSIVYATSSSVAVEVIHPKAEVFDVEIVISNNTQPTIFIIDNVDYKADLCEVSEKERNDRNGLPPSDIVDAFFDERSESDVNSDHLLRGEESTIRSNQRHADVSDRSLLTEGSPVTSSACDLLSCDFTNSTCGYTNYVNDSMSLLEWKLGNHKSEDVHAGARRNDDANGGFLFVGTDSSTLGMATYILQSPEFSLTRDMTLSFDVYRRSNEITLQVCLDSPFHCPYMVTRFDKRVHWRQGETFNIPKNIRKIFFKAVQWKKFKWLAIDNVQLIPCPKSSFPSQQEQP